MATKKTPARKAAAKKAPAKKASVKKVVAKRPYNRKKPLEKKVSPLKGRKYGPRKPKAEVVTDEAIQQPQPEAQAEGLDNEVRSILDSIGCPPCDELMEQSELEDVDILDMRGISPQFRIVLLAGLEQRGYITTVMGSLLALDVLPKLLSVDYLALNHNNKLVREANPEEVEYNEAISTPIVRIESEILFSKAGPNRPTTLNIGGATYVRVA